MPHNLRALWLLLPFVPSLAYAFARGQDLTLTRSSWAVRFTLLGVWLVGLYFAVW